jgi:hypothetical protein
MEDGAWLGSPHLHFLIPSFFESSPCINAWYPKRQWQNDGITSSSIIFVGIRAGGPTTNEATSMM